MNTTTQLMVLQYNGRSYSAQELTAMLSFISEYVDTTNFSELDILLEFLSNN